MVQKITFYFSLGLLVVILASCEPAAKGAERAFSNAGSVIKYEGGKLWQDPEARPTPKPLPN